MIVDAIKSVIQIEKDFVPLHEPVFQGSEKEYVIDCIESGWVSSVGSYVDKFEEDLASFLGVKKVIVTVNGTAALHLCLAALGVGTEDEVLLPSLTFVATANAVAYTGATPHFCDSESKYMGLCPDKLAEYLSSIAIMDDDGQCRNKSTGKCIKAIIPMHCFGHPVNMIRLNDLAEKYNIIVVEDAAESLGSTYMDKQTGGLGRAGIFSFNGNKIITTGGGGAIATNDKEFGALLKHLSTTAKTTGERFFAHDMVGYNYRMPNINAALGCAQLEQLPDYLNIKREIACRYKQTFAGMDSVRFVGEPDACKSNYWLCAIEVDNLSTVLDETAKAGLMTRPLWTMMTELPMYKNCPSMDMSVATMLEKRIMTLPSSVNLLESTK